MCELAVIGPLALGVGVVNEEQKDGPSPAAVHCSICRSPSELPKAAIGRRPMKRVDADRFARLVVYEVDLRQPHEHRPAVAHLESVLMLDPMTCSGGMPYTSSVHGRMNSMPPPETM